MDLPHVVASEPLFFYVPGTRESLETFFWKQIIDLGSWFWCSPVWVRATYKPPIYFYDYLEHVLNIWHGLTRGCTWGPTLEKYIFIEGNTTFSECIKFSRKMVYLCMRTKKNENKKGRKNYSSRRKTSNKGNWLNFLGLQKHMKCCVNRQNVWIHIFEFFWWKKYVSNKSW